LNKSGYQKYFAAVGKTLKKIRETQEDNILKAARTISEAIAAGGIVHAFGAGHSDILAEEIFVRSGTLVAVNHILDVSIAGKIANMKALRMEKLEGTGPILYDFARPKPEDVFVIISNSGRNAAQIELAREAKKHNNVVIALTSVNYSMSEPSPHSSGKRLLDFANIVLDNCGNVSGDPYVTVPGMRYKVGPTSTVTGAYILHSVMVQAVFNLKEAGIEPRVFGPREKGKNYTETYKTVMDPYQGRIKNW